MERELAAELAHAMRQVSTMPLAESARASLNARLADAHSTAERLQVVKLWFARLGATSQMIGHYIDRAEARAAAPVDDWRPGSILPRVTKR
jgi:hypothetical protein